MLTTIILIIILAASLATYYDVMDLKKLAKSSNETLRNLMYLKDRHLLSKDEFKQKAMLVEKMKKKDEDILLELKEQGILTEEEYKQKIDIINSEKILTVILHFRNAVKSEE